MGRDSRDIAIELYGEETVAAAGWYPDSWVRSRTRRRLSRARRLMRGGYRELAAG